MFTPATRVAEWADFLNKHDEWREAVNAAFDKIGFSENFITEIERSDTTPRAKAVKDHIWGMVELDPLAVRILDSPVMQRLRWVHQTGLTYITYPTANHSRFEHSIGVYHVVSRLLESLRKTEEIDKQDNHLGEHSELKAVSYSADSAETKLIKVAALLHDVGHVAFSHVTEKIFLDFSKNLRIGPFTTHDFLRDFSLVYRGIKDADDTDVGTSPEIPLSEIVSVAVINHERFRRFFKVCNSSSATEARDDLCNIGTLILGDRIEPNDFALPEILSGPVDADKIDYLVRDAHACGLSTGIDVARVFFRAGVYEAQQPEKFMKSKSLKGVQSGPIRVFVIDQSGSDALREMGQARVSLYQRVYHHHVTRNAEAHFREIIKSKLDEPDDGAEFCKDLLSFFIMTESEILQKLAEDGKSEPSRRLAGAIRNRQLLKRSIFLDARVIGIRLPTFLESVQAISTGHDKLITRVTNWLNDFATNLLPSRSIEFICGLKEESERIRKLLSKNDVPLDMLPPEEEQPRLLILPFPTPQDAQPREAFLLSGGEITSSGQRVQSYQYAGERMATAGYVLTAPGWREIVAIAFQSVVYEAADDILGIGGERTPDINGSGPPMPELEGIYWPVIDVEAAVHPCNLSTARLREFRGRLAKAGYYDKRPVLYPRRTDQHLAEISKKFAVFSGERGWTFDADGETLAAFLSQFPPAIRDAAMNLVDRFEVLGRETISEHFLGAIKSVAENCQGVIHLVPQSPSSGHLMRSYLRDAPLPDEIGGAQLKLHSGLRDALGAMLGNGAEPSDTDTLVFFDDNIASGTQAANQLKAYFGKYEPREGGNYFCRPLPAQDLNILTKVRIGFAYAIGSEDGLKMVQNTCADLSLQADMKTLSFGKSFGDLGNATEISEKLRAFLSLVGTGVLFHRFSREQPDDDKAELLKKAKEHSLGYGAAEGALITPLNVPSSTYTAFWCPGSYAADSEANLDPNTPKQPWFPLFIRSGMLQYLVVP